MTIDRTETLRYLRMGAMKPGSELAMRIDRVESAVAAACRPAAYWRLEKISKISTNSKNSENPFEANAGECVIGDLAVFSRNLARVLEGCRHAFLFCATIGAEVDALIRRYSQTSAADAVIAQAAATAAIEGWCDECEMKMLEEPAVAGEKLRMRYSPGYGDLTIETQRPLLQILDGARRVGIHLTDAFLMVPTKSVSAIIGVANN